MTHYSYAELEGLWIQAGGDRKLAPVMAAIAEAESSGNSDAYNPSGASGLWQILGNPFPGNPMDPATNARMAVAKYKSQGLGAWVTYTNGAYKAFLSGKTTPVTPGGGPPGGATPATVTAYDPLSCLWSFPGVNMPIIGNVGEFCLFSKSQGRAFIGAGLLAAGGLILLPGVALLVASAGVRAMGAAGPVLQKTGSAVAMVPGAQGAGVAISAAGRAGSSTAEQTQRRRAQRGAAEERRLGQASENPDLRTGRGAVRETPAETRRRSETSQERARRYTTAAGNGNSDRPPF